MQNVFDFVRFNHRTVVVYVLFPAEQESAHFLAYVLWQFWAHFFDICTKMFNNKKYFCTNKCKLVQYKFTCKPLSFVRRLIFRNTIILNFAIWLMSLLKYIWNIEVGKHWHKTTFHMKNKRKFINLSFIKYLY